MEEIRRDPKGRKLRTGESYDAKSGRYRYQYQDATGMRKIVYSYTLTNTKNDLIPQGKRQKKGESFREREHIAIGSPPQDNPANCVNLQSGVE